MNVLEKLERGGVGVGGMKRNSRMSIKPEYDDANYEFKYIPEDYKEIKKLGSGAFGTTYLMRNKRSNETLVVKKIPKKVAKKRPDGTIVYTSTKRDVDNEVKILKQIEDICTSNLLCYVGFSDDPQQDFYYIILEDLSKYTTLEDYILKTDKDTRAKNAYKVLNNLVIALKNIHKKKIAHRDIKPSNIMINPKNLDIKIIDFGLSCFDTECEKTSVAGSPFYMPPELQESRDRHSFKDYEEEDFWSLGITLLEFVLGVEELDKTSKDGYPDVNELIKKLDSGGFHEKFADVVKAVQGLLNVDQGARRLPDIYFR